MNSVSFNVASLKASFTFVNSEEFEQRYESEHREARHYQPERSEPRAVKDQEYGRHDDQKPETG
jgi:hypothetical protein